MVSIQFGMIFAILLTGRTFADTMPLLITELFGIFLAVWAILSMKIGNFNIRPIVKQEGVFVEKGPYKFIRHPMYSSIFVSLSPLVIDDFSYLRFAFLFILFVNLCIKCHFEEELLLRHFPQYKDYMKRTKRIIPFVY